MIYKKIINVLSYFVFSSTIHQANGFQFHPTNSFVPFQDFLNDQSIDHFSPILLSDAHLKENIGKNIVLSVSATLPKFDTVGHNILSANHDFIYDILHSEILSPMMKKEIILFSIRLAQMGDDMGSQILQYYYNLVDISL